MQLKPLLRLCAYLCGSIITSGLIASIVSSLLFMDIGVSELLILGIVSTLLTLPVALLLWLPIIVYLLKFQRFSQLNLVLSGAFSAMLLSIIYTYIGGGNESLQFFVIFSPLGLKALIPSGVLAGVFLHFVMEKDDELLVTNEKK